MGAVLPGVPVPSYLGCPQAAHKGVTQLAEAIHTTPDPDFGEPDIDDTQSILLTDTSTHRPLRQNDELFAVEEEDPDVDIDDDDDDDDEAVAIGDRVVQGEGDQEDWDDGHGDGVEQPDGDRLGLMGNSHARRSWADLSDLGENVVQNGGGRPSEGSLGAKAGIILVRSFVSTQKSSSVFYLKRLTLIYAYRAYITSSSSFRSSS
jgi:hypothetical protein